jgi:hypothetical protein
MSVPRQQINLYQPERAVSRGAFGADTLALATGAVALLLIVVWSIGASRVAGLQRAVRNLQQQQELQRAEMRALGGTLPAGASPADIDSRIQELRAELANRERALALLRQGAVGNTRGFSAQLAALASCPVPGLWLQRVSISGETGALSVGGETLEPESVPRYLRALAAQRALAGLRFDRLVIERRSRTGLKSAAGTASIANGAFTFSADGDPSAYAKVAAAQENRL